MTTLSFFIKLINSTSFSANKASYDPLMPDFLNQWLCIKGDLLCLIGLPITAALIIYSLPILSIAFSKSIKGKPTIEKKSPSIFLKRPEP